MQQWLIGIDEAGRGPLAGPVAVGVAKVPVDFDWSLMPGVTDSKKLSEQQREVIFKNANDLQKSGKLDFAVAMVGAHIIDTKGIVSAITIAMSRALTRIAQNDSGNDPANWVVKLDGALRAPHRFTNQETIIKGDLLEPAIGLASIMAKVTRDRYMINQSKKPCFEAYNFHIHKGYGTVAHRTAIARYGLSSFHRASYCQNLIKL